jgi:putative intracellular protease/amidase
VIQDKVEEIGGDLVTPGTYMTLSNTDRLAIEAEVGTAAPPTGLYLAVAIIDEAVADVSVQTAALTDEIFEHVDAFLASDCQANLVVVPILAKNSSGFYAAPSLGLIKSLQAFLDARKEVTQTVAVTSGALALVPAVTTIEIGVLPNFSQSVTETSAAAAMDGLLKGRSFGISLYRSDIHKTLLAVTGVSYVNVTIDGYLDGVSTNTTLNDSEGNLVVDSSKVITKGTTNISSVALTGIITS